MRSLSGCTSVKTGHTLHNPVTGPWCAVLTSPIPTPQSHHTGDMRRTLPLLSFAEFHVIKSPMISQSIEIVLILEASCHKLIIMFPTFMTCQLLVGKGKVSTNVAGEAEDSEENTGFLSGINYSS